MNGSEKIYKAHTQFQFIEGRIEIIRSFFTKKRASPIGDAHLSYKSNNSFVSLAITNSSSVGTTNTLILDSGAEINLSP